MAGGRSHRPAAHVFQIERDMHSTSGEAFIAGWHLTEMVCAVRVTAKCSLGPKRDRGGRIVPQHLLITCVTHGMLVSYTTHVHVSSTHCSTVDDKHACKKDKRPYVSATRGGSCGVLMPKCTTFVAWFWLLAQGAAPGEKGLIGSRTSLVPSIFGLGDNPWRRAQRLTSARAAMPAHMCCITVGSTIEVYADTVTTVMSVLACGTGRGA